jgi:hypothetical protein
MASKNAEAVGKEISETIRKGKKVVLGKIIKSHGYSDQTSKKPKLVLDTESCQKEIRPIIEQLELERQRLADAIKEKDLSKVQYSEAVRSLDLLIKNIQLLSDKPTENIKGFLTQEQTDELKKHIK